jgi:hypothetical protein
MPDQQRVNFGVTCLAVPGQAACRGRAGVGASGLVAGGRRGSYGVTSVAEGELPAQLRFVGFREDD